MLHLSWIRERLTWRVAVVAVFYLAAAVALTGFFLPLRLKTNRLEGELRRLAQVEGQLMWALEQQSGLEAQLRELRSRLADFAERIPSQFDLQKVLEAIHGLAACYEVNVENLTTSPLKWQEGGKTGVVALSLELVGGGQISAFLTQLQEALPSLSLPQFTLSYLGEGQFLAALEGELKLVMLDPGAQPSFKLPSVTAGAAERLPAEAFGLPFQVISQFLRGQVQVLGIVDSGSQKAALVAQNGQGRWLRVGDRLNGALVTAIVKDAVWLDVDGVQLKLTIGG